jgi:hypothetical protein
MTELFVPMIPVTLAAAHTLPTTQTALMMDFSVTDQSSATQPLAVPQPVIPAHPWCVMRDQTPALIVLLTGIVMTELLVPMIPVTLAAAHTLPTTQTALMMDFSVTGQSSVMQLLTALQTVIPALL